jgi:hypothetical protein
MTQSPENRRFYPPGVIGAYCVVFFPVGMLLYAINVRRRGGRALGGVLSGLSAVFAVLVIVYAVNYGRFVEISGLGVFVGIGLIRMEDGPYRQARAHGGLRARWWPPLLWVGAAILVTVLL